MVMRKISLTSLGIVSLLCVAVLASGAFAQADPTVAKVDAGPVRGASVGDVISWKGIPCAAPPVGELRFRHPQPVKAWEGIKETTKFAPAAMQTDDVPKS